MLNVIEMWERLAFYTLRVMAPIYIMQADNPGGLHLTAADKGTIYAWWAIFQSLLPTVTGGYADRFGYKRTLAFAITLMFTGYLMIAFLRDVPFISNYWGFFSGILVLATGTAFFKPSLQGSLAHILPRERASVGWGIFYWVVNVGAFIGHFLPTAILALSVMLPGPFHAATNSKEAWRTLFLASAFFTSFNLLLLLTFKDVPSGASKTESPLQVFVRTIRHVFEPRLFAWLAIMSAFWLMMYQLWDLQPNFIADWVDSRGMAESLRWLPGFVYQTLVEQTPRGPMIPQQVLLSFNALFIILAVVGVAWLTRNIRTLTSMLFGMLLATAGVLIAGFTMSASVLVLGVLFFSLGEMMTGPKKNEYLSLIAPPGKKGLVLGLCEHPGGCRSVCRLQDRGLRLRSLWREGRARAALPRRAYALRRGQRMARAMSPLWRAFSGFPAPQAMLKLQEVTGLDATAATRLLWDTYSPQYHVWIPFAAIGILAALALWIFGRMARRWSDMNA